MGNAWFHSQHLIAQNLLLSRFLTKCWKTQSTCQRRRMEYFSVCWFKSSAKNQFFYTCLNSLKPHFQTQGPRRSQLRRQLFISGFHGLISSDKAGARIGKFGGDWEELWLLSLNCIDVQHLVFISGLFVHSNSICSIIVKYLSDVGR